MQIDMHYYGTYALARAAGIGPDAAKIIAHASQYVDDATDNCFTDMRERGAMFPIMTSHKPLDVIHNADAEEQWKVWVAFHFLPGNQMHDHHRDSPYSLVERLICRPGRDDNRFAQNILDHALSHADKPFFQHIVGVTAHVFADTFSHHGFIGLSHHWNKVDDDIDLLDIDDALKGYLESKFDVFKTRLIGTACETIPVGHGAVGTYPDRPYLKWTYTYQNKRDGMGDQVKERQTRDNPADFLEASQRLFEFFKKAAQAVPAIANGPGKNWEDIEARVQAILAFQGKEEERCGQWKGYIMSGEHFTAPASAAEIEYSAYAWNFRRAEEEYRFIVKRNEAQSTSDPCNFIRAARVHRNFVLYTLLPDAGLILA